MSEPTVASRFDVDPVTADGAHVHPLRPPGAVREIVPTKRRLGLGDIVPSIPIIRVLTDRDLKARYKQSALGPMWLVVQPLGIVAAFVVAFHGVTKVDTAGVPYVLFALTGVCVWSFFQMGLTVGSNAVVAHGTFIRRVACPRHTMPIAGMLTALPLLGATLAFTFAAMAFYARAPSWRIVLLPVATAWLLLLLWGFVSVLSAVAVRFRDVLGVLPFMLQAGLFVTPVGYPAASGSAAVRAVLYANPLTGIIEAFRWVLLDGVGLTLAPVLIALAWTVVMLFAGSWIFARLEVTFADVV